MRGKGAVRRLTRVHCSRQSDDTGAVAVIVTLVISLTLLGVAAFAVDFGNAFAQRVDLQGIADDSARAGAAALPDQTAARAAAIANLCAQPPSRTRWDYSGCPAISPTAPSITGSPTAEITFTLDNGVATEIRVVPPPIQVDFGFGQVMGVDGVRVNGSSSARIASALGTGVLPFPLFADQLNSTPPGTDGQFCIGPPDPPSLPSDTELPVPGTGGPFTISFRLPTTGSSTSVIWNAGTVIQVRSDNSGPYRSFNLQNVRMFIGGDLVPGLALAPGSTRRWQAPAPVYAPGSTTLWLEAIYAGQPIRSNSLTITYTGTVTDPCGTISSHQGYLDIARDPDPGSTDRLADNVSAGLDTRLHPWPNWPSPPQNNTPLPAANSECGALPPSTVRETSVAAPVPDINCVTLTYSGLPSTVADGFFGTGGRMFNRCGGPTRTAPAPFNGTIDDTQLFSVGSPLLAPGIDPVQLKADLRSGTLPAAGTFWLTSQIFRCPRFGIVPVLQRDPNVTSGTHRYPVMGFRYVWIDDDTANRGFLWSGSSLVGIRGYIIDPALVPQLVTDSLRIGTYQNEPWQGSQRLSKVVVIGPP